MFQRNPSIKVFDFLENLKLNSANKSHKYDSQGLLKYFPSHSAVFKHPISAILPNNLAMNYIFALQVVQLNRRRLSEPSENISVHNIQCIEERNWNHEILYTISDIFLETSKTFSRKMHRNVRHLRIELSCIHYLKI